MGRLSRRSFVTLSASAAAGAVIAPGIETGTPAKAAAATTGTITDVQHVVILMQENRSFDHYFGTLKGVRGFGDRSAITTSTGSSIFRQPNGTGWQYPWKMSSTLPAGGADPDDIAQCNGQLAHSWSSQHAAWNTGKLDNWISGVGNVRTMGYLDRSDIPFHFALADNYTICDAYFCSALSATGPNRTFLWSGKIDANSKDGGDESGLTWQTYAEALQNAGVTWKVYQRSSDNFGDNGLAYFQRFTSASPGNPLYDRGMASVPGTKPTHEAIADAIRADVLNGTLPQVSWVVANEAFSEHPSAPPGDGAHFVNLVIQALNADASVFNSTVLFLNYDENDGCFDHVPPPVPPGGTTDEFLSGVPIGLGFRVPMLVISPWTRGGWVSSEVFDHTSVIRFLERWTAALGKSATCPNISAWRRKVVGDLTGVFDFASPVYGLPQLPGTSVITHAYCKTLPNPTPSNNALPAQEPGTRPARALPYQPNGYLDRLEFGASGKILAWFQMVNQGAEATRTVHFSIHPNAYRNRDPWQYTVNAGGTATDYFNIGAGYGSGQYDLSMVGPNRFLRRFIGNATTAGKDAFVSSYYAVASNTGKQAIWFRMKNTSASAMTFTITSNQYRTDGPWTYRVGAGQTVDDWFNAVAYNNGWYDFTITVDVDRAWSQRFTGHIETGTPSVSG
ncbi:phosphocholine-specific phospholipase C [Dactylosporangium sp. CA-233914]|uniref:phosphocholine-specific phospholipase C n=1 Tax=Dactylosporangium sp. CA-233914 TaxID=3239934 RepID=UPI003D93074A